MKKSSAAAIYYDIHMRWDVESVSNHIITSFVIKEASSNRSGLDNISAEVQFEIRYSGQFSWMMFFAKSVDV